MNTLIFLFIAIDFFLILLSLIIIKNTVAFVTDGNKHLRNCETLGSSVKIYKESQRHRPGRELARLCSVLLCPPMLVFFKN